MIEKFSLHTQPAMSSANKKTLHCTRYHDLYTTLPSPSLWEALDRILRDGTGMLTATDYLETCAKNAALAKRWSWGKCENFTQRVLTLSQVLQLHFFLLDILCSS